MSCSLESIYSLSKYFTISPVYAGITFFAFAQNPKLWRQLMTLRKGPFLTSHKSPLWNWNSFSIPYCSVPLLKFSMFVMATNGDMTFFWKVIGDLPSFFNKMLINLQSATPSLKWLQIDFQSLPGMGSCSLPRRPLTQLTM